MAKPNLTAERIREVLDYNQKTGIFVWKERISIRIKVGGIAGSKRASGHLSTRIFGNEVYLHRLAWFYVYGEWPKYEIDHIDGDKSNNAIGNLRDVSHQTNAQNLIHIRSNNTHGTAGVRKKYNKWHAVLTVNGKTVHLGSFTTKEAAHSAYLSAKRSNHQGCTV